ncbi:MAG: hypothetical protein ACKVQA_24355 [Burkholderiales bacterium]
MAERHDDRTADPKMDPTSLYREEVFTDRKVGMIRVMYPVKADGASDGARSTLYVGEAQMYTSMGALPLSFEIDADSLQEAVSNYAAAAKDAVERTVRDIQELRRQSASSIVIPQAGAPGFPPPGMPGGGKIQLP